MYMNICVYIHTILRSIYIKSNIHIYIYVYIYIYLLHIYMYGEIYIYIYIYICGDHIRANCFEVHAYGTAYVPTTISQLLPWPSGAQRLRSRCTCEERCASCGLRFLWQTNTRNPISDQFRANLNFFEH